MGTVLAGGMGIRRPKKKRAEEESRISLIADSSTGSLDHFGLSKF